MASSRGKELIIIQTNWLESCPSPSNPCLLGASSIPKSATGQSTWTQDVAGIVTGVSGRRGIFYSIRTGLDSECEFGASCG
jgi:hypothetical protein